MKLMQRESNDEDSDRSENVMNSPIHHQSMFEKIESATFSPSGQSPCNVKLVEDSFKSTIAVTEQSASNTDLCLAIFPSKDS